MDSKVPLWPSFVTQVVSHLIALSYASIVTRDTIEVQTYTGWACLLCIGAIGLLIIGSSNHLSILLDHLGCSEWKEPVWVMVCNVWVFSCVHSIHLITGTESQLAPDAPSPHGSFPDPEELDRGSYTTNLVLKLEANRNRFRNNRRREEDYRVSGGELPPFLRAIGEDVEDPPSTGTDDEDEGDVVHDTDFLGFIDPTGGSPTVYPRATGDGSQDAISALDMRPRIRPENLYRRPVSVPGFPPQPLMRVGPPAPAPQTEQQEDRVGRPATREGEPPAARSRPVSPYTARNYPLYAEYLRNRVSSPQLSITPTGSLRHRPGESDLLLPGDEEEL